MGSIEPFKAGPHKETLWNEKLKFFLLSYGVADAAQKKAMLLYLVGIAALAYVLNLNMPRALDDGGVTFNSLVNKLRAHFGEKTTELAAWHKFSRVVQKENQSVDEFAEVLWRLALYC